jgi:cytochrome c556
MRRRLLLTAGLLLLAACSRPEPPRTTVQQYMEGEINPAAEFLFHSVQEIADEHGARLKAPQTPAEWREVREQAAVLQRAPELLTARGLKVAPPGFKAENPPVESEPAWIQKAMDANRADFDRHALRLKAAADAVALAAEAQDPRAMQRALDGVDKACESCHLHYFYPNDRRAWLQAREDGVE